MVRLDYILSTTDESFEGTRHCALEIQAGGETSSTNSLTRHVLDWSQSRNPTNDYLGTTVAKPNPIPNNAWKRTLEQVFRKAPLCMKFGGGFAMALGKINFDYFRVFVRGGQEYIPNWEICLIEMADDWPTTATVQFRPRRAVFMTYDDFVESVRLYPYREDVQNPFAWADAPFLG